MTDEACGCPWPGLYNCSHGGVMEFDSANARTTRGAKTAARRDVRSTARRGPTTADMEVAQMIVDGILDTVEVSGTA